MAGSEFIKMELDVPHIQGCQVELEIWPRMPHTWQVWARVMPEAGTAIERIGAFVQSKT